MQVAQTAGMGPAEAELNSRGVGLYSRFCEVRGTVLSWIAARQQEREDTESGAEHLIAVHGKVDQLVHPAKVAVLSPAELFCLLCAVYLHDVAKAVPREQWTAAHHAASAKDAIITAQDLLGLSASEALTIGYIVEGHGPCCIGDLPELRGIEPYGIVRARYLAALLRLADDLDMCFTRAPRIARLLSAPGDPRVRKWNLRESIDHVEIQPTTWLIRVHATPLSEALKSAVLHEVEVVNARLQEARPYLRQYEDIGLYYTIIDTVIDDYWIRQQRYEEPPGDATIDAKEPQFSDFEMPDNAAVVVLRYDPLALRAYRDVLSPLLTDMGYTPVLIDEDMPTAGSLAARTLSVLQESQLVLVDLSDGGAASVHFRLGLAMGLRRPLVAYSRTGSAAVGDLAGMSVVDYGTDDELRSKIRAATVAAKQALQ